MRLSATVVAVASAPPARRAISGGTPSWGRPARRIVRIARHLRGRPDFARRSAALPSRTCGSNCSDRWPYSRMQTRCVRNPPHARVHRERRPRHPIDGRRSRSIRACRDASGRWCAQVAERLRGRRCRCRRHRETRGHRDCGPRPPRDPSDKSEHARPPKQTGRAPRRHRICVATVERRHRRLPPRHSFLPASAPSARSLRLSPISARGSPARSSAKL